MEVTCDRCGAEYEFEGGLISSTGTTVKCTNCGHLFKVTRDEAEPSGPSDAPARAQPWNVHHADGRHSAFANLKAVTLAIRHGELVAEDRISRTGRVFRRLGDIDELQPFFEERPTPVQANDGQATPDPSTSGTPSTPPPRPRRPRRPTPAPQAPGVATKPPGPAKPAGPPPEPAGPSSVPPPKPETPSAFPVASSIPPPEPPTPPRAPEDPEEPAEETQTDPFGDLDVGLLATERSRWVLPVAIAAVTLGAVLAFTMWRRPAPTASTVTQTVPKATAEANAASDTTEAVEDGDRALEGYDVERFPVALAAYRHALKAVPKDPHLLSSLSRVHALWSQALEFRAQDVADGLYPDADLSPEALRSDALRHAAEAKEMAAHAARKNPGNEEAEVALSDALRLTGNLVGARLEIDRVLQHQSHPDAETLRVAALLAAAEADDLAAGAPHITRAAGMVECAVACQVVHFRTLVATGNLSAATAVLAGIEKRHRGLSQLPALQRRLQQASAAEAPQTGAQDAGSESAGDAVPAPQAPSDAELARAEALCDEGEKQLEQGAVPSAAGRFRAALAVVPDYARAEVGLGYVAMERGAIRVALRHFRHAAGRNQPEAFIGLGESYRALERPAAAMRAYRTYLRRFPNMRSASIARQQLEHLQAEQEAAQLQEAEAVEPNEGE